MTPNVGTQVPEIERTADAVDLFMFSASAWLLHRIHYDLPYTTQEEAHPGLLIHGPLQGTYIMQAAQWWLGDDARLKSITYRHKAPAYLGDTLMCGGEVTEVTAGTIAVDVWAKTSDGTVTTEGRATFSIGEDS